jgi:hypothetical protein
MLTGLPDCATARMKSVCRHRKAGVCSTSTTSATCRIWLLVVHVGQHGQLQRIARTLARISRPCVEPRVRGSWCPSWRLALSKLLLKMNGMPSSACDVAQPAGGVHLHIAPAFDGRRAGDQEEADGQARRRNRTTSRAAPAAEMNRAHQATAFRF